MTDKEQHTETGDSDVAESESTQDVVAVDSEGSAERVEVPAEAAEIDKPHEEESPGGDAGPAESAEEAPATRAAGRGALIVAVVALLIALVARSGQHF